MGGTGVQSLTEDQNSFTLRGRHAALGGKPHLIARMGNSRTIIAVKTGRPSPSHGVQVMLYPESTDGRREGWANWDEGAYKGESLGSIETDVTRQRVYSSRTGPRERSMEAGNRVIVRSDAAGCTRGPGAREFGGVGSVADSAVRPGVGWLAVGPGRE